MKKRLVLRRNLRPKAPPSAYVAQAPSPRDTAPSRRAGEFTTLARYRDLALGVEFILEFRPVDGPIVVWRKRTVDLAVMVDLEQSLSVTRPMNPMENVCIKAIDAPPERGTEPPDFTRRVSRYDGAELLHYTRCHFGGLFVGEEFCFNTGGMTYHKIDGGTYRNGRRGPQQCRSSELVYRIVRERIVE